MRKSPLINVMERAVRKAGRSLLHDFGEIEQLQVSRKGPGDFAPMPTCRRNVSCARNCSARAPISASCWRKAEK